MRKHIDSNVIEKLKSIFYEQTFLYDRELNIFSFINYNSSFNT